MPVTLPFRAVFAASAVALSCCACVLSLLKSVLRAECPAPGGSSHHPVVISCMVAAALSFLASATYLVKSRVWSHAAAICSKWQPVYFLIVSVQRLVLTAIVAYAVVMGSGRVGSCSLESEYENAVHAVSPMWSCAVLMAALATMCSDREELPPGLRRCAYGLLALVLLLDAIGSVVWGNPLANDASFSLTESFSILLDNQLTSCIASQAVLALHFLYVSCRSRRGRGWAYASLRFELDECGKSMWLSIVPFAAGSRAESGAPASLATPMLASDASAPAELQHAGAARWNALTRLRQRWLQFKQRQVSHCRVFVIPCVAVHGAAGGGEAGFALARPAFNFRWLRPLQRLADAHPRLYFGFVFLFLAVPSFVFGNILSGQNQSEARGILLLVSYFLLCIFTSGFLCSKQCALDRVAVKHIALSFRFGIYVIYFFMLLASNVAHRILRPHGYTSHTHPTTVVASAFGDMLFCLLILLDCSPHLPTSFQTYVSVMLAVAHQRICLLNISAGCMVVILRLPGIFRFSKFICWSQTRLFPGYRSVQDLHRYSEALHLHQHPVAADASARIAHACARHQQLRQRVGEALASARMRQHVGAKVA
jgi:hypothetical protein